MEDVRRVWRIASFGCLARERGCVLAKQMEGCAYFACKRSQYPPAQSQKMLTLGQTMASHSGMHVSMICHNMTEDLLHSLLELRPALRERWEALLRAAPAVSPLGHPDALIHMMDWTLDNFFNSLHAAVSRGRADSSRSGTAKEPGLAACACGQNPLTVYFVTAECALVEVALPLLVTSERIASLGKIRAVLQRIANEEIEKFCAICQHAEAGSHARQEPALA